MMILIHAPLKRDYIIGLLNNKTIQGVTFSLNRQEQMKLYFNHDAEDETAVKIAKETIKSSEFGSALFFNVSIV